MHNEIQREDRYLRSTNGGNYAGETEVEFKYTKPS